MRRISGSARADDRRRRPQSSTILTALLVAVLVATATATPAMGGPRQGAAASCLGRTATITAEPGAAGATLVGTPGDDVIVGTAGDDLIVGMGGNDIVCGLAGDDVIHGDAGHDVVSGGPGHDELDGGPGRDRLRGGPGDDILDGGRGRDLLVGNRGDDQCVPGLGRARGCSTGDSPGASAPAPDSGNDAVDDSDTPARRPGETPPEPVLPRGMSVEVVGSCNRVDGPPASGENPYYVGASFCTLAVGSTQVAPTLPGTDENVTVFYLCNAANGPIDDLKSPFACLMSPPGYSNISGAHDLAPRDAPGAVSGRYDWVRTGESYCAHAGSVTYYDQNASGWGDWLPNPGVVGPRCFELTHDGRIVWD